MTAFLVLLTTTALAQGPSVSTKIVAEKSPIEKAKQIAQQSKQVMNLYGELQTAAKGIKNKKMQRDALEILNSPQLTIVAGRKNTEAQIIAQLKQEHLVNDGDLPAELFPKSDPMPFIAAPASAWRGHHSFPGGLVYHTLVNLKNALNLARTYHDVYHLNLDVDMLTLAPIWHDYFKTSTIAWHADGTSDVNEGKIAGTGRHHVLGVAEALYRNYPAKFIVVVASAHAPASEKKGLDDLLQYLRAAVIISGKTNKDAGLTDDGKQLRDPAPIESYVHHLSDHDFVFSEVSIQHVSQEAEKHFPADYWRQDAWLAEHGDIALYKSISHQN